MGQLHLLNFESKPLDLTGLKFSTSVANRSTGGMLLKAFGSEHNRYYKLSAFNSDVGFYGMESIIECICSDYLIALGFNCVKQELCDCVVSVNNKSYRTLSCASDDYNAKKLSRVSFDVFCGNKSAMAVVAENGWQQEIQDMFIADFLIYNRDRHGANIEVLGDGTLSPLFDHGNSLLCSVLDNQSQIANFDIKLNGRVNNFVGYPDLMQNLRSIACLKELPRIDICSLLSKYITYCSKQYLDKTAEFLMYRRNLYDRELRSKESG